MKKKDHRKDKNPVTLKMLKKTGLLGVNQRRKSNEHENIVHDTLPMFHTLLGQLPCMHENHMEQLAD